MAEARRRRDPFAGLTLAGKYEVIEPLARGGMGRVYRALQKPLDRPVALKILDTDQLEGQAAIEDFQKRFFLEAAAVAKLQHPNTVVVYDYGKTEDDDLFIAMELLEGENLHDTLKREKTLSARRAAHIALQVCGSIGGAHDQGMVHRDLKPSNIMLTPRGNDPDFVKVLDFGLVKQEDNGLTQSGALLGTPRYMAPEQITGDTVGPAADIYSLGAVLYHLLAGRPPFDSESKFVLLASHMNESAPPLREVAPDGDFSPELEAVVMRCLRKQPVERYDSMEALARALAFCPEDTATADSSLPKAAGVAKPDALDATVAGGRALETTQPLPSSAGRSTGGTSASASSAEALPSASRPAERSGVNPALVLALALLVGGGLAGGLWYALSGGPEEGAAVEAADSEGTSETSEAPAGERAPERSEGVETPSAGAAGMENAQAALVSLASDPPGARVSEGGVDLGDTPTTVPIPAGESRELVFSLRGYESRTVRVSSLQPEVRVSLQRLRRGSRMRDEPVAVEAPVMETPMMEVPTQMSRRETDNRDPWAD